MLSLIYFCCLTTCIISLCVSKLVLLFGLAFLDLKKVLALLPGTSSLSSSLSRPYHSPQQDVFPGARSLAAGLGFPDSSIRLRRLGAVSSFQSPGLPGCASLSSWCFDARGWVGFGGGGAGREGGNADSGALGSLRSDLYPFVLLWMAQYENNPITADLCAASRTQQQQLIKTEGLPVLSFVFTQHVFIYLNASISVSTRKIAQQRVCRIANRTARVYSRPTCS